MAAAGEGADAQPDLLQPAALFEAYALARKLPDGVVEAGREILGETTAETAFAAAPPVHVSLDSVSVEGFGSFASRTEYPLRGRGLLLLRGAHGGLDSSLDSGPEPADGAFGGAGCDDGGALTGTLNLSVSG